MNHDFCPADMFTLSSCHHILGQWKILVQMAIDTEAVFSTSCSREKMCCLKQHGNMREATANWHSLLTPKFEINYCKVVAHI